MFRRETQEKMFVSKWGLSALLLSLLLTACGGGGGSSESNEASSAAESGELTIALTDAEGDFLSYNVNVLSIELKKANGTVVETVPLSTKVDFALYTEMTEFFTVATVPEGKYTSAKLRLDYSDAEIVIENAAGDAVNASAVDTNGDPLTTVELTIQLEDSAPVHIRRGVPANMMIDFDLKASNEILSYAPAVIEVDSYLVADLEWDSEREHRARGLLKSVDQDEDNFVIDLLPFLHRQGKFGELSIAVVETTQYEINGENYEGETGLAALAALDADTPVVAHGTVSVTDNVKSYTANTVYAGSSVAWADSDAVMGVVVAREGDQLTVRGRYINSAEGEADFDSDITVMLGEGTTVTRQALNNEEIDINSISVGQRIVALGAGSAEEEASLTNEECLEDDSLDDECLEEEGSDGECSDEANSEAGDCDSDSEINYTLDTTEGHVRMLVSDVKGQVESLEPLTLDLASINDRNPEIFDFTGTGVDEANDADSASYEVETQTLTLPDLHSADMVSVKGFVAPFGAAPEDFIAQTVINVAEKRMGAALVAHWAKGSENPFTVLSGGSITLDPANARHDELLVGGYRNLPAPDSYIIVPVEDRGRYALKVRGQKSIQVYSNFEGFVDALAEALQGGSSVKQMLVKGRYDAETGTIATPSIHMLFW